MSLIETLAGASRTTLGFLTGWKGYAAAGVIGAALAGWMAHSLTATAWRADYNGLKAEYASAQAIATSNALNQLQQNIKRVNDAAAAYAADQAAATPKFTAIAKELQDAIKAKPLPDNCRPDAERLRLLHAAIDLANGADKPTPSGH